MNSKYNVLVNYLGDGEFKFSVKRIGEVSISKERPVFIYNADVEIAEGEFGLSNVASTVAKLLGYEPDEHWNPSIIK